MKRFRHRQKTRSALAVGPQGSVSNPIRFGNGPRRIRRAHRPQNSERSAVRPLGGPERRRQISHRGSFDNIGLEAAAVSSSRRLDPIDLDPAASCVSFR